MKKSAAFTLIELLVVITIIAILAGIALPVFTMVQERGQATKDANNLKQIGIGMTAYLNDHDDSFFVTGTNWSTLNPKYIPDWRTFQSPFDRRTVTIASPFNVSYDFNKNLLAKSVSDVASSSNCIMVAPLLSAGYPNVAFNMTDQSALGTLDSSSNTSPTAQTGGTHSKGKRINALFQDAHVESMLIQDFHDVPPMKNSDTTSPIQSSIRWNKP